MNTGGTWILAIIMLVLGLGAGYWWGSSAHAPTGTAQPSDAATKLQLDMRKLWTDHTVWTRDYIIAATNGSPDANAAAARLLKNQDDIGNALAGYYGSTAGAQVTALLKQHIEQAVTLIADAKAGDNTKVASDTAAWQANANQIADALSALNPDNWPDQTLRTMMQKHLDTTIAEVKARLTKDWSGDVVAYDAVYNHILMMADALSAGIIKQFPQKF